MKNNYTTFIAKLKDRDKVIIVYKTTCNKLFKKHHIDGCSLVELKESDIKHVYG